MKIIKMEKECENGGGDTTLMKQATKLGYTDGVKIKSIFGNTKGIIIGKPYQDDKFLKINVKTTFGEIMPFILFDKSSNRWAEKL